MAMKSGRVGVDFREVDTNGYIKPDPNKANVATKESYEEPEKVALLDNAIIDISGVSSVELNYPANDFDCIVNISTAAAGAVSVDFGDDAIFQPTVPNFGNSEIWTMWIRSNPFDDGVIVAAQKATAAPSFEQLLTMRESFIEPVISDALEEIRDE